MNEGRGGQVVTFYSYKGGTGRTMALANLAWILAANGKRVLVADWDLESPGLHRFFKPFIEPGALSDTGGVIDLVRAYEEAAEKAKKAGQRSGKTPKLDNQWHEPYARVQPFTFSLNWTFPGDGTLDFLPAGRQNNDYAATLIGLDWDYFYGTLGGGRFLDALRSDMKHHYDYTLIDSRTGLSDVANICTILMPDTLVDCFTLSDQGIDGAAKVAHDVQRRYERRQIRILPVPMRVDPAEKMKVDIGRAVAMHQFAGLPSDMLDDERSAYWSAMQVPYRAFYAYEETLAVFGDPPGSSLTLLSAYETLATFVTNGQVTRLPAIPEAVRTRINAQFARQLTEHEDDVALTYHSEDQVWADWIDQVLSSAGIRVVAETETAARTRKLLIVSSPAARERLDIEASAHGEDRPPLAVFVTDLVRPLPGVPATRSVSIAGHPANVAADRILGLVGRPGVAAELGDGGHRARFPGKDAFVFNVGPRNTRFTGREADLRRLRELLRASAAGNVPVALIGTAGIGKTQLAIEYAHRFSSAYDVVWWINADPVLFVDSKLGDLGTALGLPAQASVGETTRAVLKALGDGDPYPRWLVIFDNADDWERVSGFLPRGAGNVLITSRNRSWSDRARIIDVEVFQRDESIALLRHRVPALTDDEAYEVGEALGDLPIAVNAAGAWLAETGTPVREYLRQIESSGATAASVDANWDLSLKKLREESEAAYRLLQLCSVTAPEISIELVYSDELAKALTPFDQSLADRSVRGRIVQFINRLALIRVDIQEPRGTAKQPTGQPGQIQVHRLLQQVVRSRMTEEEQAEARHQVHLMLAASRPRNGEVDDPFTWPGFRRLWPHLEVSGAVDCPDEDVRNLMIDRVRYIWITGGLEQGTKLAREIEQKWEKRSADMAEDDDRRPALRKQLLHLRFTLANLLRDQAKFAAAHAIDVSVLDEQVELLGSDHAHTLMTAGGLAADLRALGQYEEARKRDEVTYEAWARNFGKNHPRTLVALGNLAASNRLAGDYRSARRRDEDVYNRRRVSLGDDHPNTLLTASSLGRDLREAGEYPESVELLTTVWNTYVDVLGPDSRSALNAEANLAVSLRSAGRAAEAADLLDHAYENLSVAYGPDALACRLSRSMNLLALAENAKAADELKAVTRAYQDDLGPAHPHTLVCANNLAAVARALEDRPRAFELARAALDGLGRVLGSDHPYTLAAKTNLAVCTAEDGNVEEALVMIRGVGGRLADTIGPEHPDTLRCRGNEALMRRRLEETVPEEDEAMVLGSLADRLGLDHPTVVALREGRYLHRIIDPHPF